MGFAAGFSVGNNAVNSYYANKRQAKLDERGEIEFNQRQDKIKNDLAYEDALKVSVSPGQQTAVMQGIGDNGSNFNTKDAGAASMMADMAAAKGETVGLNDATRVSTGRTGATMQGTVAGNQVFAKPAEAQAFAQTQSMTDLMELEARRDVARQYGKMDVADDMKAKIAKLDSEGVFKAFSLAQSGDLEGAAKVYQATGDRKLPEGAKFVANEVEDAATKTKRQVISVVGADGAPLVPDLDKALRSYLTPQEQYTMNRGDTQDARLLTNDKQAQDNFTETLKFNREKDESDRKYKERVFGIQASQEARAQAVHKKTMENDKLPQAVKMQADSLAEQMKNIGNALNKSMAEGQFDPNNAGTMKLMESQAALGGKYSMLLKPYSSDKGAATSDPLGLGAQEPAAKPAEAVKPSGPPARPASSTQSPSQSISQGPTPVMNPGEKPERGATEPLQSFKDRLVSWDKNRMAFVSMQDVLKQDEQRKLLLQSRPDLARLGQGLR